MCEWTRILHHEFQHTHTLILIHFANTWIFFVFELVTKHRKKIRWRSHRVWENRYMQSRYHDDIYAHHKHKTMSLFRREPSVLTCLLGITKSWWPRQKEYEASVNILHSITRHSSSFLTKYSSNRNNYLNTCYVCTIKNNYKTNWNYVITDLYFFVFFSTHN